MVQLNLAPDHDEEVAPFVLIPPISREQVRDTITSTKPDTAAGVDQVRRWNLLGMQKQILLWKLLNWLLIAGKLPSAWKHNKTTLLLKEGKDPLRPESYRPITISSLISRLFWGIIDWKLRRQIRFNTRQKGFVNEQGCYNNVHILGEILRHSKIGNGLVAVQLDVSKAFHTVPHSSSIAIRMCKHKYTVVGTRLI